ncbi:sensor histidine kinase [Skermania piniformis]|uniref:histidine kinase n=1 Tax=Skermania pinensis TaxID=39122 RepID=A0ABX8S7Q3_9ACTN|nr:HAMP domain-containing sensor histidine kinase [Skermania piniformis]QXQ13496.1 HAMP domain-containing histidine kinase [Skermania piniformis]
MLGRVRTAIAGIPLRVLLVVALVMLAGFGLFASGVAVTSAIEKSLISRADQQLRDAAHGWARARPAPPPFADRDADPDPGRPPSLFYVETRDSTGQVVFVLNDGVVTPDLDEVPPPDQLGPGRPVTVGSLDGSSVRWRAIGSSTPAGRTTIAIRLTDVDDTVDRLVVLQLGIGAAVLVALGVAAYFVIRRSLRPLVEVERTAVAIAAGDLHRRVPVRGTNTEVDRLAQALNEMLSQIQRGYAATAASEDAARQSESRMRRFVADASHELRTPLTTIRGYAELFRQGATTDTSMLMGRIESEAVRMGMLVEDLLMLARLDAQRPLDRTPVDLLTLAGDAVRDARARSPERDIRLEVGTGPGGVEVAGDEPRLRQVLSNLVGNAISHTPADAQVTVRLVPRPEQVAVQVIDTGPGMAPEDAARVFERFYRTDGSRTRHTGGTGLGLSIVSSLVDAHGGTVSVDTELGVGTTFTVELPRMPADVSDDGTVRRAQQQPEAARSRLGPRRVP